jgi:hypothetical protein
MRKGLASLIRLRRWRLDEERRQLTGLMRAADQARDCLTALEAEIERERVSAEDEEAFFAFAAYAGQANARRITAAEATRSTEAAARAQRDAVLLCHRELRSGELAEHARLERLAREAERREQGAADERAVLNYTPPLMG